MRRSIKACVWLSVTVAFGLLLSFSSCADHGVSPEPMNTIRPPLTDRTAEVLALVTSGEVIAPLDLYETVHDDMEGIRESWCRPDHQICRIQPQPIWAIDRLVLSVMAETYDAMKDGTYKAWDSLNAYYRLNRVEFHKPITQMDYYHISLVFDARLNPQWLVPEYSGLAGVNAVEPSYLLGDWPNVYLLIAGSTRYYTFRNAWGDCPSGCIENEFWYFHADEDGVYYDGNSGNRDVWLLQLRRLPGFDFCPPINEVFTADLRRDIAGHFFLTGTWLGENDMITMPCTGHIITGFDCVIEVPFGPIELTADQVEEFKTLATAIPDEYVAPDFACDGCLITEYWLHSRRVVADHCAFGHSDEFWTGVAALEEFLHGIVFEDESS